MPVVGYEIRKAKTPTRCQLCSVLAYWRAVYLYDGPPDVVTVPRCPVHLAKWARYHELELPKEALA